MARVSLIDEHNRPELSGLIAKIRGARGGRLLNIYRMMLHSPALAGGWFELNQAVRFNTEVDGQSRELAVMRVAILNGVDYIVHAHGSNYALKEGLSPAQVHGLTEWSASGLFSDQQRALLAYVDAMTRQIDVPDKIFEAVRTHYNERQIVELTMLVGAYNMLTRVLKALEIDSEPPAGQSG